VTEAEEEVMGRTGRNHGAEDEVWYDKGWHLFDQDIGTQVL
jgi:hypothetical protein